MPQVSVVIPVYNRADYVAEAIASMCAQTLTDIEIVVVDDGSTDDSREQVRAYPDDRVQLVCNDRNRGLSASRNHGISVASGRYVAFLDSDDRATPDRLERQVAFLEANPDHAAVSGWMRWIDADGRDTGKTKRKAVHPDQIAAETLFRSCIEVSAATARTDIMRAYPHREAFVRASDYDLWARIVADYKLATLPHVLLERRRHPGQATFVLNDPEMKRACLQVIAETLVRMGVDYDDEDLERHYLLRRMHKVGFWPDPAYLTWAERWLSRLQGANHSQGLFPEPMFTAVLGTFWAKTCLRAIRGHAFSSLWQFVRSPLRRAVWPGLRAEAQTRLRLNT